MPAENDQEIQNMCLRSNSRRALTCSFFNFKLSPSVHTLVTVFKIPSFVDPYQECLVI